MEQLFKNILEECEYEINNLNIPYYSKGENSFFFWINFEESVFKLLKTKTAFDTNDQYKAIMDGFKSMVEIGNPAALEKNSSLIVMVKCSSITALSDLQQQILLLEEDEYFLKKYVILYTEESIASLTNTPIRATLLEKINNSGNFESFASSGYQDDLAEYLLIMQLFIKLPFLVLRNDSDSYMPLSQKLQTSLANLASFHSTLLSRSSEFEQVDFNNAEHESKIDELISLLPND